MTISFLKVIGSVKNYPTKQGIQSIRENIRSKGRLGSSVNKVFTMTSFVKFRFIELKRSIQHLTNFDFPWFFP